MCFESYSPMRDTGSCAISHLRLTIRWELTELGDPRSVGYDSPSEKLVRIAGLITFGNRPHYVRIILFESNAEACASLRSRFWTKQGSDHLSKARHNCSTAPSCVEFRARASGSMEIMCIDFECSCQPKIRELGGSLLLTPKVGIIEPFEAA